MVLKRILLGDPTVLLVDFRGHLGNDGETWRGMIGRSGLPDLKLWCLVFGLLW